MTKHIQRTDEMERGSFAGAQRRGSHVIRNRPKNGEYSETLLREMNKTDCNAVPELLGHDSDGRQVLRYIEGETGYPPYPKGLLTDRTLLSIGKLVREVHDTTSRIDIPAPEEWAANEIVRPDEVDCIGHNDLAPWNIVFRDGEAVAIIDWDTAGPSSRVWDLSYLAHHVVPFHSDESLRGWGWTDLPDRAKRLDLLLEGYGQIINPDELIETAIVRLSAMGAHIQRQGRRGDLAFREHYETGQGHAYIDAASNLIKLSKRLTKEASPHWDSEDGAT